MQVPVFPGQSEVPHGFFLGIELNQNRRLGSHHPGIVARLDDDDLRRHELERAAVGVFAADTTADEQSDVCVHAEGGADDRPHVSGPAKAGRVHEPLDPPISRPSDIDRDTGQRAAISVLHGRDDRVVGGRPWLPARSSGLLERLFPHGFWADSPPV